MAVSEYTYIVPAAAVNTAENMKTETLTWNTFLPSDATAVWSSRTARNSRPNGDPVTRSASQ